MKKILYYYLLLLLATKAVCGGYLFISQSSGLPMSVFAVCLVLLLSGLFVAVRHHLEKDKPNEIMFYFLANALGTMFNLFVVSRQTLLECSTLDMMVTGSLFDFLIAGMVAIVYLKQKTVSLGSGRHRFVSQPEEAGKQG